MAAKGETPPPGGTGRGHSGPGGPSRSDKNTGRTGPQSGTRRVHAGGRTVLIAAYREVPRRLDRLERVARSAIAAGLPVTHLFDEKGRLHVAFYGRAYADLRDSIASFWELENEIHVEGLYRNGRVIWCPLYPALLRGFPRGYFDASVPE